MSNSGSSSPYRSPPSCSPTWAPRSCESSPVPVWTDTRVAGFYKNDASGEFWNRAVNFYEQNRNKKGLTLDLAQERARETLRDLIAVSDVFTENFTPRVIKNFGLEYEDLRRIRPDIIMVSSTGYGHTGPWSGFGAIGYGTEAASGLASVTGYRDGPPTIPELPYADYTAGEHTVFAIMAALAHRAMTGRGQFIDISQTQTLSATVPEPLMDFTFNGAHTGQGGQPGRYLRPPGFLSVRRGRRLDIHKRQIG